MFERLQRLLQGKPPPIAPTSDDPVLGTLSWSKDDEAWLTRPELGDVGFAFQIYGTPQPAPGLLRHAAEIVEHRDEFILRVNGFLSEEVRSVRHLSPFTDEIAGLKIECVCLYWPDRPNDGMIYFIGGRDYRLWRCDYVARAPKGLGFDS